MAELDRVTEQILDQISGEFKQEGAYNLRQNGVSIFNDHDPVCHLNNPFLM